MLFRSPDSRQVSVGFDDGLVKIVKVEGWAEQTELTCTQVHSNHKEVSKDVSIIAIQWGLECEPFKPNAI